MRLTADALYYAGGRPTTDGNSSESLENARLGLTLSRPFGRYHSLKLNINGDVYSKTGTEFLTVGAFWQVRWGGGL